MPQMKIYQLDALDGIDPSREDSGMHNLRILFEQSLSQEKSKNKKEGIKFSYINRLTKERLIERASSSFNLNEPFGIVGYWRSPNKLAHSIDDTSPKKGPLSYLEEVSDAVYKSSPRQAIFPIVLVSFGSPLPKSTFDEVIGQHPTLKGILQSRWKSLSDGVLGKVYSHMESPEFRNRSLDTNL